MSVIERSSPSFQELFRLPPEMVEIIICQLNGRSLIALSLCNLKTSDDISQLVNSSQRLCEIWIQQIASQMEGISEAKVMVDIAKRKVSKSPAMAYFALSQTMQQDEPLSRNILFEILQNICQIADQQLNQINTAKFSYHYSCLACGILDRITEKHCIHEDSKINRAIDSLISTLCRLAELEIYWRANNILPSKCLSSAVMLIQKSRYQRPKELNALIERVIQYVLSILKNASHDLEQQKIIIQIAVDLIGKLKTKKSQPAEIIQKQTCYRKRLVSSIYPDEQRALLLPAKARRLLELAIKTAIELQIQDSSTLIPIVNLAFQVSSKCEKPLPAFQSLTEKFQEPLDSLVQIRLLCHTAERHLQNLDCLKKAKGLLGQEDKDKSLLLIVQTCCKIAGETIITFAYESSMEIEDQDLRVEALCHIAKVKPINVAYSLLEKIADIKDLSDVTLGRIAKTCCQIAKKITDNILDSRRFFLLALRIAIKTTDAFLKIQIPYKVCKFELNVDRDFALKLFDIFVQKVKKFQEHSDSFPKDLNVKVRCKLAALETGLDPLKTFYCVEELLKLNQEEAYRTACRIGQIQARADASQLSAVLKLIKEKASKLEDYGMIGYAFSRITNTLCEIAIELAEKNQAQSYKFCLEACKGVFRNPSHLFQNWGSRTPLVQCYSQRIDILQIFLTCLSIGKITNSKIFYSLANRIRVYDQKLQQDVSFIFRELCLRIKF